MSADKPVDTAIVMVVGPCIDDTDFKTLEEAIAYNAAGMDVSLIVEKTDGTTAVTAITLTTGGTSDWTHKDGGYYEIEVTAAQNAEEGIGYIRGICTGVLPFESPRYSIVKGNVYDSLAKGTDKLQVDITQLAGVTQSLTDLKDFADEGYDPGTNKITGTVDMRGTDGANTVVPDAAGTAPTVGEIRTEMEGAGSKLLAIEGYTDKIDDAGDGLTAIKAEVEGLAGAAMRGTDGANTTTPPTVGAIRTEMEGAGTKLTNTLDDTNELQTDWKNGGRLDLILDIIAADTTTDLPAKILKYIQLLSRSDAAISTDNATELTAINADGGSGAGDFSNQTDGIEAIRNRGDAAWVTSGVGAAPTVEEIRTEMDNNSTKLAKIKSITNFIRTKLL